MFPNYLNKEKLHEFIRRAIREDHGDGDHTSLGSIKEDKKVQAHLLFKEKVLLQELNGNDFGMFPKKYFESFKEWDKIHPGGSI